MEGLSEKQAQLVREFTLGDARRWIVSGVVGSGKTLASCLSIARTARFYPGEYLLAAPQMGQVRSTLLGTLKGIYADELVIRSNAKEAELGGSLFHLYSGSDATSEMKIRGLNLNGALIDEAVGVHDSFIEQTLARLRKHPRKVLLVTNPDGPHHPLKAGWIDKAPGDANLEAFFFGIHDNPSLPDDYYTDLESSMSGAMLKRMVRGEWALSSGSIYGNPARYSAAPPDDAPSRGRWIGVDYGTSAPTLSLIHI